MDNQTLVAMLRWRGTHQPQRRGYTFLNGDGQAEHLTYAELDEGARAIAVHLQSHHLAGERALLIYPPGLAFIKAFFGCLYAGVMVVPTYPPHQNRPNPRLQTIVKDAQPAAIFSDLSPKAIPALKSALWIQRDSFAPQQTNNWQEPAITPETVAFLQYTSGSTSSPKGVQLTHRNLWHNFKFITQGFSVTTENVGVIWTPPYHDLGLIGGILQPLYVGMLVVLMSPLTFLQNPLFWLQTITRYKGNISGGPNFAYDLCVDKIPPEQRANLDLSSWTVAFNGAEPIRPETLTRFTTAFAPHGFRGETFYPCYGLAEVTLMAAGGLASAPPVIKLAPDKQREVVGCGQPAPEHLIKIVDPDQHHTLPEGQVGEIWVAGPSVSPGYWGHPEKNAAVFAAQLKDEATLTPFLRTGDLGFMVADELFITGRRKDLIIIRGKNYYPQDVEQTAKNSHLALQQHGGAAFGLNVDGEEQAVIVFELRREHRKANVEQVAAAIRAAVAYEHNLDVYRIVFIRPGHLPRTTSGKTQRYRCREMLLAGTLPIIGESIQQINRAALGAGTSSPQQTSFPQLSAAQVKTIIQAKLAAMLHKSPAAIDLGQPLPTLGLSSMDLITLKNYFESEFGVELEMELFFEANTIEAVIAHFTPGEGD